MFLGLFHGETGCVSRSSNVDRKTDTSNVASLPHSELCAIPPYIALLGRLLSIACPLPRVAGGSKVPLTMSGRGEDVEFGCNQTILHMSLPSSIIYTIWLSKDNEPLPKRDRFNTSSCTFVRPTLPGT